MNKDEIAKLLKPIVWDYDIEPFDLFEVAVGNKDSVGGFTREKALTRMFERLSWYDLIRLFGVDRLKDLLSGEFIQNIEPELLREKYELARKLLHGEAVSPSGWEPEYREKIRHALLSNRRRRAGSPNFLPYPHPAL